MNSAGAVISDRACQRLMGWFREASGICLPAGKRTLVAARLRKRLGALDLPDFEAYCDYVERQGGATERQLLVDLLTTNETYFFREPAHFKALAGLLAHAPRTRRLRVWSAACSTGEEAYSLAMTLSEHAGDDWEVVATDLSARVRERARRGLYLAQRLDAMPAGYLQRYFLRGTGQYAGTILVQRSLRERVRVMPHNLMQAAQALGKFDVIFLRNVLIYFDPETKAHILSRVVAQLQPGGHLFVGHAEALARVELPLQRVAKSVYRLEA